MLERVRCNLHHANQFTSSDKHHLSNMWMAYNVTTSCSPLFGYIRESQSSMLVFILNRIMMFISKQPTQSKLERLLSPDFMSRSTPRQNVGTQSSISKSTRSHSHSTVHLCNTCWCQALCLSGLYWHSKELYPLILSLLNITPPSTAQALRAYSP